MKFSLKTLAAAVALAVAAGSASAAIDIGQTGNGELFFSAWDGQTSYNFDMGMTISGYLAEFNTSGKVNLEWKEDKGFSSSYQSWLGTADTAKLQWSVLALDGTSTFRILSTVDGSLPANNNQGNNLASALTSAQSYVANVNGVIGTNSSLVTTSTSANTYAGKIGPKFFNTFNFDTAGSVANNSYASGLGFEATSFKSTTAAGTNVAYVDEGVAVRAWVDGNNTLHIAAVPEPSEYALLLAGLGLMGVVARRRSQKQA